jgi:hypothetical protein
MVTSNGWNFSFQYLKEVFRLVVQAVSGRPRHGYDPSGTIRVNVDSFGLPTLIPLGFRLLIRDFISSKSKSREVRWILTMIQIYRVFPTQVKPDLGTITSPFSG